MWRRPLFTGESTKPPKSPHFRVEWRRRRRFHVVAQLGFKAPAADAAASSTACSPLPLSLLTTFRCGMGLRRRAAALAAAGDDDVRRKLTTRPSVVRCGGRVRCFSSRRRRVPPIDRRGKEGARGRRCVAWGWLAGCATDCLSAPRVSECAEWNVWQAGLLFSLFLLPASRTATLSDGGSGKRNGWLVAKPQREQETNDRRRTTGGENMLSNFKNHPGFCRTSLSRAGFTCVLRAEDPI